MKCLKSAKRHSEFISESTLAFNKTLKQVQDDEKLN